MHIKIQLSDSVMAARAGLIPDSDYLKIEKAARMKRTERIVRTTNAYAKLEECGSKKTAIVAILADLRHYCEGSNMRFDDLNEEADKLYWHETDVESGRLCR